MTPAQLNKDIKKLAANIAAKRAAGNDKEYDAYMDASNNGPAAKEFKRLYHADQQFEYMSYQSMKTLLRLNLRYRFVPLHSFGLHIDIPGITI